VVRSRPPVVNYTHDVRIALRHPLILDGFCACTFYLVFKEPGLTGLPDRAPKAR